MNRIVRSEHLTAEEVEKYNKIREQVEDEFPPLYDEEAPTEGDYTSTDHVRWYQYGKLALVTGVETCEEELRAHMNKEGFWPNAWFISDHGNPVQLHIGDDKCK